VSLQLQTLGYPKQNHFTHSFEYTAMKSSKADDENEVVQALHTTQGIATMAVTVGMVAITAGMVHWHNPSTLDTMFSDPERSVNQQANKRLHCRARALARRSPASLHACSL